MDGKFVFGRSKYVNRENIEQISEKKMSIVSIFSSTAKEQSFDIMSIVGLKKPKNLSVPFYHAYFPIYLTFLKNEGSLNKTDAKLVLALYHYRFVEWNSTFCLLTHPSEILFLSILSPTTFLFLLLL